jgi:hypothetical protein
MLIGWFSTKYSSPFFGDLISPLFSAMNKNYDSRVFRNKNLAL